MCGDEWYISDAISGIDMCERYTCGDEWYISDHIDTCIKTFMHE